MTIKHIVLLPFKSSLSQEEISQVMEAIGNLQQSIPQILSFSWGENNSVENLDKGYLHGFVMEFKNSQDRQMYLEHPEHSRLVQEIILPALVDGGNSPLVFDYTNQT